jgi:hypothetical protein
MKKKLVVVDNLSSLTSRVKTLEEEQIVLSNKVRALQLSLGKLLSEKCQR